MPATRILSAAELAQHLLESGRGEARAAVLLVVDHPDPALRGGRILFQEGGRLGSLGDPVADREAEELARRGLSGDPSITPGRYPIALRSGGEAAVYLELHHPHPELIVVGAGHIAQPLCTLGHLLGLTVRVLDDRPRFATRERFPEATEVLKVDFSDPFREVALHPWTHVVLVTRGHRYDFECLRSVLRHRPLPAYIGMIGSRRRVRATFEALLDEGIAPELLSRVSSPIGLDIGAETPTEIALSVAAELVLAWHGGSGKPLKEVEQVLTRLTSTEKGESRDGS